MATINRQELHRVIDTLPESRLAEVAHFLEFVLFKIQNNKSLSKTSIDPLQAEIQAFEQLHPTLKQQYYGQFVAIHQGKVIDAEDSFEALFLRIQGRLETDQVLIRQVTDSPAEVYHLRSPRLEISE